MKINYYGLKSIYLHEMDRFRRTLGQSLLFHDIPMATIKAVGYVTALVATFAAIAGAVAAVSTGFVDMTGGVDTGWMANIDYAYALPGSAMDAFTNMIGLEWVGGVLNDFRGDFLVGSDPNLPIFLLFYIILIDQISKFWILGTLGFSQSKVFIPYFLNLNL